MVGCAAWLESHLREYGGGRLFYAPLDCVFTDFDIVEPDLLLVTADQLQRIVAEKAEHGCGSRTVER